MVLADSHGGSTRPKKPTENLFLFSQPCDYEHIFYPDWLTNLNNAKSCHIVFCWIFFEKISAHSHSVFLFVKKSIHACSSSLIFLDMNKRIWPSVFTFSFYAFLTRSSVLIFRPSRSDLLGSAILSLQMLFSSCCAMERMFNLLRFSGLSWAKTRIPLMIERFFDLFTVLMHRWPFMLKDTSASEKIEVSNSESRNCSFESMTVSNCFLNSESLSIGGKSDACSQFWLKSLGFSLVMARKA